MNRLRRLSRIALEWGGILGLLLALNVPNAFGWSLLLNWLYRWWQDYQPRQTKI